MAFNVCDIAVSASEFASVVIIVVYNSVYWVLEVNVLLRRMFILGSCACMPRCFNLHLSEHK